jgi:carboxynorspermidine decarboxylase
LAGDIIGAYSFDRELQIGDDLQFLDMAHYTMVKTTTFNGVALPDICLYNEVHGLKVIREFSYDDYKTRLS